MTDKLEKFIYELKGSFVVKVYEKENDQVEIMLCNFDDPDTGLVMFTVEPKKEALRDINFFFRVNDSSLTLNQSAEELRVLAKVADGLDRCYLVAYGHEPIYIWDDDNEF